MDFIISQQLSEISVFKNYICGVVRFRGKKYTIQNSNCKTKMMCLEFLWHLTFSKVLSHKLLFDPYSSPVRKESASKIVFETLNP